MQLNSNICWTQERPTKAVLLNSTSRRDHQNRTPRQQDGWCRVLLPWAPPPGSGSTSSYDRQATDALQLQIGTGGSHENILHLPNLRPFQSLWASYSRFMFLATHSSMKMLWEKAHKFGVVIKTARGPLTFPRRGDKFLILVLIERGHSKEVIRRLRIHLQVIFLSDVLTLSGNRIEASTLQPWPNSNQWLVLNWPKEEPTLADMILWKEAPKDICPSKWCLNCLGLFIAKSHQVWEWQWCALLNKLLQYHHNTSSMDVYKNTTKKLNRYTKSFSTPWVVQGDICSMDEIQPGVFCITSTAQEVQDPNKPLFFVEVLHEWGYCWLCEHISIEGGTDWIVQAITAGSLVAVTDRSYTWQLYLRSCSAAFILECTQGRGQLIGLLKEASRAANAYRGELLGLMAVHLILVSMNWVRRSLRGSIQVVSNCLRALQQVTYLPPYRIPSRCKHSNILKNLLVNYRDLPFSVHYSCVKAHQDNTVAFDKLSRKSQLNSICDHLAKQRLSKGDSKWMGDANFSHSSQLEYSLGPRNYRQKQAPS